MYTLSVKNKAGDILSLMPSDKYTVYKIDGLNPPKANVNQSVNTTTDGGKINSTRLENRNIVLYMAIEGDIEANRINLYNWFMAKRKVSLFFKNGARDVYIEGTVELIECDLFSSKQVVQVSIICPEPYFKGVETLVTSFSDIDKRFSFPFSIPKSGIEFSVISTNVRKSIINTGDVTNGVIITLFATGTVVNPALYDVFKRTHMKFNFTMQASDTLVINTNVGKKSITLIRDGAETNATGYMLPDSSWFTVEAGDNVYTYGADSGSSNLQITFRTSLLYGGV